MENKTVILTTLNAAWASRGSIIDLFIESFRTGDGTRRLLDHLVIIALDKKAYIRCMSLHTHCFALYTVGVDFSDEKIYMTAGYLSMMWRRIEFLRVILEMGYNFIFSVKFSFLGLAFVIFCSLKYWHVNVTIPSQFFFLPLFVVHSQVYRWCSIVKLCSLFVQQIWVHLSSAANSYQIE